MKSINKISFFVLVFMGCGYTILKPLKNPEQTQNNNEVSAIDSIFATLPSVEDENDEDFWNNRISYIQIGMSREDVYKMLPRYSESTSFSDMHNGRYETISYWLDLKWMITLSFDQTGNGIDLPPVYVPMQS